MNRIKNKIFLRLILYFFISFVLFSLVNGGIFFMLFSHHNVEVHKAELERRAAIIASTASEMLNINTGHGHGMGGMGGMQANINSYLAYIDGLALGDVWLVDSNLEILTFGHGHRQLTLSRGDIPQGTEQFILDAFFGEIIVRELDNQTITAAAPIFSPFSSLQNSQNVVVGVVLLHSPISDIDEITATGLHLLYYSTGLSAIMAVFLAIALSSRFTNPLNKMKKAALQISNGDYTVKTGVSQTDEIGELAAVLDNMAIRLNTASQESAKLDKLRKDFTANISHELRTPVTVIRASLEALCDGVIDNPNKIAEYYKQMLFETVHLERLIADLLELSKLQNPDFVIEKQPINLSELLQDSIRSMQQMAKGKNISVAMQNAGNFSILGDYGRLRQMFVIVLDNAIKFSPTNGTVNIGVTKNVDKINVSIIDNGCGISEENLAHIFDRFYKQRSEQNKQGSGLGLAIAKQIADRHNVTIIAKSKVDVGTQFEFIIEQFENGLI
ncbi:MAG: HAMP domain-containing histidine kinase [Firmicutes bacterium]|nr:HAMP domain-containing histidine kinase [Bacillota bacterium]